ncbi:hypothetical protein GCM10022414_13150 [Zhongshania borealis]|uniref:Mannose-1-phosphate guanylyltransferase n=1 Tax=Zhongshania borealis TaxID=889488 RepID=A0ABP7WKZ5_9GAMM
MVAQQFGADLSSIILEPVGRNAAPPIALAAFDALESAADKAPLLLIMAADHVINDVAAFHAAVEVA